jgi:hypothetical protein
MPVIPFADNFLAGAIISLVIPAGLLVAVVIWYHLQVRRVPGPQRATPRGATPENPPAANPATGGQGPVGEATSSPRAGS